MSEYEAVNVARVRNGYLVERPWAPSDPTRQVESTFVFNDFDELTAHLEMVLGDPKGDPPSHPKEQLDLLMRTIRGHDLPMLRKSADRLQGEGGEDWAIGEMVIRAIDLLEAEDD